MSNDSVGPVSYLWTKILVGFAVVVGARGSMGGYGIPWGFITFILIGAAITFCVEKGWFNKFMDRNNK